MQKPNSYKVRTVAGIVAFSLGLLSGCMTMMSQRHNPRKDPTIAAEFDFYHFADYRDKAIDLLKRVCTVSVETTNIVRSMEEIGRQKRRTRVRKSKDT